jgi:hypothetical protein
MDHYILIVVVAACLKSFFCKSFIYNYSITIFYILNIEEISLFSII